MIFITWVGVTTLMSLQTPTRFIHDKIPAGKEY
jgi:hypothetical protein